MAKELLEKRLLRLGPSAILSYMYAAHALILCGGPGANVAVQVLFAIMTGVFGLAGWHFCKPPSNPLRAIPTCLLYDSALSHKCLVGAIRLQSHGQRTLEAGGWCRPLPVPSRRRHKRQEGRSLSTERRRDPQCDSSKSKSRICRFWTCCANSFLGAARHLQQVG